MKNPPEQIMGAVLKVNTRQMLAYAPSPPDECRLLWMTGKSYYVNVIDHCINKYQEIFQKDVKL